MSRGDTYEARLSDGGAIALRASKRGRRLSAPRHFTQAKVQWIEVSELTQFGRPTGNKLTVRLDQVLAIGESKVEP